MAAQKQIAVAMAEVFQTTKALNPLVVSLYFEIELCKELEILKGKLKQRGLPTLSVETALGLLAIQSAEKIKVLEASDLDAHMKKLFDETIGDVDPDCQPAGEVSIKILSRLQGAFTPVEIILFAITHLGSFLDHLAHNNDFPECERAEFNDLQTKLIEIIGRDVILGYGRAEQDKQLEKLFASGEQK